MEDEIIINRIKKENGEELKVNWILDLSNRHIKKSKIEQKTFLELFDIKSTFQYGDIKDLNLILYSDNIFYYCNNCIFGFNIDNYGNISIFCNNIDYIITNTISNYDDLKVNKYVIEFELPSCIRDNYIAFDTNFKYSKSISISLKKEYKFNTPCSLILTISITNLVNPNKLSNLAYKIYELLMIYFGVGLKISNRTYFQNDISLNFYASIVDKYSYGVKNSVSISNLVMIDNKSLNKELIQKYIVFDKETLLLNGIYLTTINIDTYREIKINMMIQCIEGFYKSIYGKNKDYKLWQILEEVFLKNLYCKKILSNLDKRKIIIDGKEERIFLYKAKNHRNYFSHLNINERKQVFEKNQINYAYWKIILAYRLLILQYLNVKYDKNLLDKIIKDINNYKKKNKIRLSI